MFEMEFAEEEKQMCANCWYWEHEYNYKQKKSGKYVRIGTCQQIDGLRSEKYKCKHHRRDFLK